MILRRSASSDLPIQYAKHEVESVDPPQHVAKGAMLGKFESGVRI